MIQPKPIWRVRMKTPRCNHFTVFCVDEEPTNAVLRKAVMSLGGTVEMLQLCQVELSEHWDYVLYDSELGVIESYPLSLFETSA